MSIHDYNSNILKIGFPVNRFKDGIIIILASTDGWIYCFFLLTFYLLGCFKIRFFQYNSLMYNERIVMYNERIADFLVRNWNPISIISVFVFWILNPLYGKENIFVQIPNSIIIDIDDNNTAYVV